MEKRQEEEMKGQVCVLDILGFMNWLVISQEEKKKKDG